MESDALTSAVVRHFFHLTPTEPAPDAWVQCAEEWEHRLELYWVPLRRLPPPNACTTAPVAGLLPFQAAWLSAYAARLLTQNDG